MKPLNLILLPGMHGGSELFEPLRRVLPQDCRTVAVSYPHRIVGGYRALLPYVEAAADGMEPALLLAESFSGPLALWFAREHPEQVRAVVLVASFVRPPTWPPLARLAWPGLLRVLATPFMVRRMLLNGCRDKTLVANVVQATRLAGWDVLCERIRQVSRLDCTPALCECAAPVLYVQAKNDRLVPGRRRRDLVRLRPDTTIRVVDGPHLLAQAAPTAVWQVVEAFLEANELA